MPAGGNSRFRDGYSSRKPLSRDHTARDVPMSERQQVALLLQMTSQEMTSGSSSSRSESSIPTSNARSSPLHHKGSKSRWSHKNADLSDLNSTYNRQDDRLRLLNGCDPKDRNEFAGSSSPDEVIRQATGAESPVAAGSPAECAATVISSASASSTSQQQQQDNLHLHHHHQLHHLHHIRQDEQVTAGCRRDGEASVADSSDNTSLRHLQSCATAGEEANKATVGLTAVLGASLGQAASEMRRTPPQNKGDRQGTTGAGSNTNQQQQSQQQQSLSSSSSSSQQQSQSQQQQQSSSNSSGTNIGSSPRVTLRLNQVRSARDEKKSASAAQQQGGGAAGGGTSSTGSSSSNQGPGGIGGTGNQPGSLTSSQQQLRQGASGGASVMSSSQMDTSKTSSSSSGASNTGGSATSSGANSGSSSVPGNASNTGNNSSSSSADSGDVYEFKSSKEATPVRGSSTSPNPNPEKDGKDASGANSSSTSTGMGQSHNVGSVGNASTGVASTTSSSTTATTSSSTTSGNANLGSSSSGPGASGGSADPSSTSGSTLMTDEPMITTTSPQSSTGSSSSVKRPLDDGNQGDDQDEEGRKRKKKDNETSKDPSAKGAAGNRQVQARNNPGVADKNAKPGKQTSGPASSKSGQCNTSSSAADRKSPSTSLSANSPKPSNTATNSGANSKGTPSAVESDGEDDRSKSSDSGSAPKVPPLKIVIPQSTTSEQEQGNRNGKSTSNRGHQLPYVVASSNSNDSMDKDSLMAATSGTTSPLDNCAAASKGGDEKKDFSGALDGESRSTHHQRVLRSSHRSGNGGNGSTTGGGGGGGGGTRETSQTGMSGNGNYSNSSPLPANSADRSNNSSPQQRHNSPTPESNNMLETGKSTSQDSPAPSTPAAKSSNATVKEEKTVEVKKEPVDSADVVVKKEPGDTSSQAQVELHPRKRKIKSSKEAQQAAATAAAAAAANETTETTNTMEVHPHDQPITNCYQLFLNIRKQIERRRKGLFPVQPKPPQGFKDYLMNRCTYVLAGNANNEPNVNPPVSLQTAMRDLYVEQEKERFDLRMQHVVEKEKLVLSVEQEILRVHGRAARALANQSLPFSVCTILKDEEVYNVITPEQEEKDRNARSRYNGRLFLSWLQDVDDKWEKIKEAMLLRHHNEAESLHAVQRMDWEWKLKEVGLCEFKATPQIELLHVPMVHVSDDFDLLPA